MNNLNQFYCQYSVPFSFLCFKNNILILLLDRLRIQDTITEIVMCVFRICHTQKPSLSHSGSRGKVQPLFFYKFYKNIILFSTHTHISCILVNGEKCNIFIIPYWTHCIQVRNTETIIINY